MEKKDVWPESRLVRFGSVDKSYLMTLNSVFDFFQEAAISHAENLGVGPGELAHENMGWILSRMSVEIDRRPGYGENVIVRTWPRGTEKLFALRDFDIGDAAGNTVIRARSCWLIIDMRKRRPLRPRTVTDRMPLNEGLDALPYAAGLEERPGLKKKAERPALYSDLDNNGHVNNVSYVRWIEDALDPAFPEQARQIRLDINYLNEILPGEVTEVWSGEIDAEGDAPRPPGRAAFLAAAFEGKKNNGNQTAFRAELRLWK
ncbi:MAG: thioesterase [Treponema sp.]|nr:thioesterase [Treponema sp.]